jgi:hypothetical protein
VIGRNDRYSFEVFSPDGRLERVIRRPVVPVPVTAADQQAYRSLMRKLVGEQLAASGGAESPATLAYVERMMKDMQFAEHFPVYASLMGGPDNTLWVQHFPKIASALEGAEPDLQNLTSPDWDVFDSQGRLLGTVTLPERFNGVRAAGNAIYGVQRDELDVQHVVRLTVH